MCKMGKKERKKKKTVGTWKLIFPFSESVNFDTCVMCKFSFLFRCVHMHIAHHHQHMSNSVITETTTFEHSIYVEYLWYYHFQKFSFHIYSVFPYTSPPSALGSFNLEKKKKIGNLNQDDASASTGLNWWKKNIKNQKIYPRPKTHISMACSAVLRRVNTNLNTSTFISFSTKFLNMR